MGVKSAQRQFLVTVEGIPEAFMTKTGGDIGSTANKVYDGGSLRPDVIASPAEADDITVTRGYDVYRDGPVIARLNNKVGRWTTTVSVTPLDADMVAVGAPEVYPDALLIGLQKPEVDASSGDAATFGLTFAIAGWQ